MVLNNLSSSNTQTLTVTISVRTVHPDGTFSDWTPATTPWTVPSFGLTVNPTGNAHLLIGSAYDDSGQAMPLGGTSGGVGNIRRPLHLQ